MTFPEKARLLPAAGPVAALLSGLLLVSQLSLLWRAFRQARASADQAVAHQAMPRHPRVRILVMGDSTAVGMGARRPESLVALLAERQPRAEIVNLAFNGARVGDLLEPAQTLRRQRRQFDLALLLVGGNDVIQMTPRRQLVAHARRLLQALRQVAPHTVWLGCADIGRSPALLPPLSWLLSWRTERSMRLLQEQAVAGGADFIDFAHPDCWRTGPGLRFAADGLHPSASSYRYCFEVLTQRLARHPCWGAARHDAEQPAHAVCHVAKQQPGER